jgi:hypothetical protein
MNYNNLLPKVGAHLSLVSVTGRLDNIPSSLETAAHKAYNLGIKKNIDFVQVSDLFTVSMTGNPRAESKAFSNYVTGRGFVATRSTEDSAFIIDVKATQERNKDNQGFQILQRNICGRD